MHIWHYTDLNIHGIGGVEAFIRNTTSYFLARGCTVHVGTTLPPVLPSAHWILHTHGDFLPNVSQIRKFPQSCHWIHIAHGTSIGRVLACKEFFSFSGYRGILRDYVCSRFADRIICVSPSAQKEINVYFRIRGKTTIVVPNGADEQIFQPLKSICENHRLLFIGRANDRVKNMERLIEACQQVASRNDSFELAVAPGINANPTDSFINNVGPCFNEGLFEQFTRSRGLILSSLYEGDSLALREAKATGIPILASHIPQIHETLKDYPNALFFNPYDAVDIAKCIEKLLSVSWQPTPVLRSWSQVGEEYLDFYCKLQESD